MYVLLVTVLLIVKLNTAVFSCLSEYWTLKSSNCIPQRIREDITQSPAEIYRSKEAPEMSQLPSRSTRDPRRGLVL